jgi:hypothetical protein
MRVAQHFRSQPRQRNAARGKPFEHGFRLSQQRGSPFDIARRKPLEQRAAHDIGDERADSRLIDSAQQVAPRLLVRSARRIQIVNRAIEGDERASQIRGQARLRNGSVQLGSPHTHGGGRTRRLPQQPLERTPFRSAEVGEREIIARVAPLVAGAQPPPQPDQPRPAEQAL